MPYEIIASMVDMFGIVVGLFALTLALVVIGRDRRMHDQPFILVLYLIGVLTLVVGLEMETDPTLLSIFARTVMLVAVSVWLGIVTYFIAIGEAAVLMEPDDG